MYTYPPFTSTPPPPLNDKHRHDNAMPPPASTSIPRKRKLLPRDSSPSASPDPPRFTPTYDRRPHTNVEDDEDDEVEDEHETTRKRPVSKAKAKTTREALRKANHSLIERRRREKINAALADLREMVPGLGDESKGGEFKLEVLERTVAHMRELKEEIGVLRRKVGSETDDETESEAGLPPPNTLASRPAPSPAATSASTSGSSSSTGSKMTTLRDTFGQHPSLASLLSTAPPPPPTRPPAPPQAPNPTLYLPFPTPSPTSPFLSYSSSTSSGLTDPSPYIAPLQSMSLFGGALEMSPINALGKKVQGEEEQAANVLLAFSSPDVMRPTVYGMTALNKKGDSGDEFTLDGGTRGSAVQGNSTGVKGKTARDILEM